MNQSRPTFTYLGHATIRYQMPDGRVGLIDPWVGQNPACPDHLKELDRLDAMLITHAHFDHLADAVELAKRYEPEKIAACFEICHWMEGQGVQNTSGMNLGGSQEVLGCKVSMVRADHSSGLLDDGKMVYGGEASGFVVELPSGFTFYHAGDTALFSDMQLIAEIYRPSLAFLPIGDLFTMDPLQAARACRFLGIQQVIPVHWGTFPVLTGRPEELEHALGDMGCSCEVITLKPGDSY